jgi:D-threo-aldose 1-dehydrogenase
MIQIFLCGAKRMRTKKLIGTDIITPILGLGTGHLGLPHSNFAREQYTTGPNFGTYAKEDLAVDAVIAALDAGIRFIDTAPWYGKGMSERAIGLALKERPAIRGNVTIATKIGHLYPEDGYDFTYRAAMKSFAGSQKRLDMEQVDILHLHDPMSSTPSQTLGVNSALQAMTELRDKGMARYLGIGANDPETAAYYIATGMFTVAIVVGAWSLLTQKAEGFIIPWAKNWGTGLIAANALERGILATGFDPEMHYVERKLNLNARLYVNFLQEFCGKHKVPLAAAAIQWTVRHPQFGLCIPGARTRQEVEENVRSASVDIPESFWKKFALLIQTRDCVTS